MGTVESRGAGYLRLARVGLGGDGQAQPERREVVGIVLEHFAAEHHHFGALRGNAEGR